MVKSNFNNYQLSSELLKSISMLNFTQPTKVQEQVIPEVLMKKDVIVKSQTGSGKTAAFAIPICELIDWLDNKPQALVIVPTRELAIQVKEDFFNLGRFKRLKALAIYGKSPFVNQEKELKQKVHIVVGTPGRIIDHLQRDTLDISNIKYLVIDEADEMLNMGFIEQIEKIINSLSKDRVTLLLSATMPQDIVSLCDTYMKNPISIEIEEKDSTANKIEQQRYNVEEIDKIKLLKDITVVENPDSCIIFCNTKQKVDNIYNELTNFNYLCKKIHGGMEQRDRLKVMSDFKLGYFRYLVATDVAARGIDIDNISLVFNFDIPLDKEIYVHRIGRTGRQNKEGKAITFVTKYESKFLNEIQQYINQEIPLKVRPEKETVRDKKEEFVEKNNTIPEIKETKGAILNKEILKLHINAGKKAKIRPADIVGIFSNLKNMSAEDIGIINVLDIATFVEILNNKGEMVLQELQNTPIRGKIRKVSKANK